MKFDAILAVSNCRYLEQFFVPLSDSAEYGSPEGTCEMRDKFQCKKILGEKCEIKTPTA